LNGIITIIVIKEIIQLISNILYRFS